ncbi:MAG TPA: efflux RND transporter periplasmic adaptor subunit [Gemmatimonadaceae bacterium]|nr:efflux RND transporter periplasmic adaptor subunit [Gemmatimonadaceae bacterium]
MTATKAVQSRRTRNRGIIVVALVLAIALAAWLVFRRGSSNTARQPEARQTMSDVMPGMAQSKAGDVELTTAQLSQFGVTFDTVKIRTLSNEVRATGIATLDETRISQITPKFAGYIDRLYVNATGQPVRRGQPVASIFSPELVSAQNELLVAARLDRSAGQSNLPGSQSSGPSLLAAARQRLRLWDISESQIDEILRSGKVQRTLTLYSPASGIVVEKNVVQGQSVMPGMQLMTVADLSTIWINAELRESDAGSVQSGSPATIELTAFPGETRGGRISYIYPTLEPQARTVKARIVLPNPGGRIKPGMYGTVRITTPMANALTVPSSAVIQTGDRVYVFVRLNGGKMSPRDIRIGRSAGNYTEIIAGVRAGEQVVASAQFLLDSESNLGEVMRSMIGQGVSSDKGADMKGMDMPPATKR